MRSFICVLLVTLGLLGVGFVAVAQDQTDTPTPVSSELCAVDAFHLEGQAHSLIGMGPQKDIFAKRQDGTEQPTPTKPVALDLPTLGLGGNAGSGEPATVTILIVDDFSHVSQTPHGVNAISHGQYVETLLTELLDSDPRISAKNVSLQEVNIALGDFTVTDIAQRIDAALSNLQESRIVLNMSFAFIPCDYTFSDGMEFSFRAFTGVFSDGFSLADYLKDNPSHVKELLQAGAAQSYNGTVLGQLIDKQMEGDNFIAVASAGNYGDIQLEPFAPASWPSVIAVSADVNDDPSMHMWTYTDTLANPPVTVSSTSNAGDVMVSGGWYDLGDQNANDTEDQGIGTSFAAPVISLAGAEYLSNPNQSANTFIQMLKHCTALRTTYGYYALPDVISGSC